MKHLAIDHLRMNTESFDYTLSVMRTLERQVCFIVLRTCTSPAEFTIL
jgi:hypothetical protein